MGFGKEHGSEALPETSGEDSGLGRTSGLAGSISCETEGDAIF